MDRILLYIRLRSTTFVHVGFLRFDVSLTIFRFTLKSLKLYDEISEVTPALKMLACEQLLALLDKPCWSKNMK